MNQQHDFFIKRDQLYKLELENITARFCKKNELIVINGGQSPQEIYFAHKKGWSINNDKINKPQLISLKKLGAKYLIIDKNLFGGSINYYPCIYADANFSIYSLE